ncbi:MAG TPA: hypothetical protein VN282_11460 [Pyrinomonadaceae bacterium]|nr:hypothetical protein [Pyrinomonadaceae bacterium]
MSTRKGGLRNFGVYLLPDGTEVVAVPEVDGCHLFRLDHWPANSRRLGDYVVYRSGLIRSKGRLTGWRSKDLKDTGRTAR